MCFPGDLFDWKLRYEVVEKQNQQRQRAESERSADYDISAGIIANTYNLS